MGVGRGELLAIEQAAVCGWPALRSRTLDGWCWRHTSGGSVRANTVAALAFTGQDVEGAITQVETLYRAAGAPPRFTISEVSLPVDLDDRLAARGYVRGDDHVTMAKRVVARPAPADTIEVGAEPTLEWLEVYLGGLSADRRGIAPRILAGLPVRRTYFACRRSDRIVASGLSVADGALASVQCMATGPDWRRQGCARSVLGAIECWAAAERCRMLYLQTGADNAAALALYRQCGFFLAGRYHTRVLSH